MNRCVPAWRRRIATRRSEAATFDRQGPPEEGEKNQGARCERRYPSSRRRRPTTPGPGGKRGRGQGDGKAPSPRVGAGGGGADLADEQPGRRLPDAHLQLP